MSSSRTPGDAAERERLIESHLPLVRAIARRYVSPSESLEDLIQVGAVALVKASDRFDPERGVAFATFATPAVEGEIRRYLGERTGSVRIPRELRRMTGQLERERASLAATLGRAPTIDELAGALGVEQADVERALEAQRAREPAREVPDDQVPAKDDVESLRSSEDRLQLAAGAEALDERERRIVFLRFHADMTEREIAGNLEISQSQVSRLLTRALEKLREALEYKNVAPGGADIASEGVISPSRAVPEPPPGAILHGKRRAPPVPETKIEAVAASEEQAQPVAAQASPAREMALPYRVTVKPEGDAPDPRWLAVVEELPGCEARGESPDEAVENLRALMERWLSSAVEDPQVISPPRPSRRKRASAPSGRFLVRMPSALHEELTRAAEREQVSLNRFVTAQLEASVASPGRPAPVSGALSAPAPVSGAPRRHNFRVLIAVNLAVIVLAAAAAITLLVLALQRGI